MSSFSLYLQDDKWSKVKSFKNGCGGNELIRVRLDGVQSVCVFVTVCVCVCVLKHIFLFIKMD